MTTASLQPLAAVVVSFVAAVIFLSTLLTLTYIGRLLEALYFTPAAEPDDADVAADTADAPDTADSSVVADGGVDRVATERIIVVAVLALSTVALFAAADPLAAMLDPVFGRFFK